MGVELHRISILVVEDDKKVREMLEIVIKRKFSANPLYVADNGKSGLEIFKSSNPEIVITDINMPEMDGFEMASTIKTLNSAIKLIVITGYNNYSYREKFSNIGTSTFLAKPIDFKKLFAAIETGIAELSGFDSGLNFEADP